MFKAGQRENAIILERKLPHVGLITPRRNNFLRRNYPMDIAAHRSSQAHEFSRPYLFINFCLGDGSNFSFLFDFSSHFKAGLRARSLTVHPDKNSAQTISLMFATFLKQGCTQAVCHWEQAVMFARFLQPFEGRVAHAQFDTAPRRKFGANH